MKKDTYCIRDVDARDRERSDFYFYFSWRIRNLKHHAPLKQRVRRELSLTVANDYRISKREKALASL